MALDIRNYTGTMAYVLEQEIEGYCDLYVYKGTPLTADTYVDPTTHSADQLAFWSRSQQNWTYSSTDPGYVRLDETTSTNTVVATGTGTATWFALVPYDRPTEVVACGTVSDQTGTGDLWLLATNIVTGENVTIGDFEFDIIKQPVV